MTNEERDEKIIEMHTDIKWLKECVEELKQWNIGHRSAHSKYIYYFLTTAIACILSWFK